MTKVKAGSLDHIAEQLRDLAVPIEDLIPDSANARTHDAANMEAIENSLRRFGQMQPIVVERESMVVRAGNGRLQAAKNLGWTHLAAVLADHDKVEMLAFAIADNRTAELAAWDDEALGDLLRAIDEEQGQVSDLGFDEGDLARLLDPLEGSKEVGEDEVPAVPSEAESQPGELFVLGDHRLLCGDSTNPEHIRRLFGGQKPFMMVTDPPYGVEYSPEWRVEAGASKTAQVGKIANDHRASWAAVYRHFPGDVAYVWHAARFTGDVERSLVVAGLEVRAQIIWMKRRFALSRGHYHWRHEPCWYAVRKGGDARWCGSRKQQTVWADIVDAGDERGQLFAAEVDEDTLYAFEADHTTVWEMGHDKAVGGGHSTQKPVEAMARPIRNHGSAGDVVFDPFLGTGTTLVACEQLGRRCVGMELNPAYVDVIVQRWENLTGQKAVREQG